MAGAWSAGDIDDQRGRLAIITGANSGIGFEAAKALALAGADVVLATRSGPRGDAAVSALIGAGATSDVTRADLDLSRLESVRAFAQQCLADGRAVDLLINNAGVMAVPKREVTVDGFELQLATNFLGHFALSAQLFDVLRVAQRPRVISLSSTAARYPARIHLDDLQFEHRYSPWAAYGQSKLAMLMFALELDRRSRAQDWGIMSTAAHPGFARTNLQTTGPRRGRDPDGTSLSELAGRIPGLSQSASEGALPTLYAATSAAAHSGGYYGPTRRFGLLGPPGPARPPRAAEDASVARSLWAAAERLTGVTWPDLPSPDAS